MKRFQELRPTLEQIAYCKALKLEESFYHEHVRESTKEERLYGFLGEVVVADLFDEPRPKANGNDDGHDINFNGVPVDVKVRILNAPPQTHYYVRVYKGQVMKETPKNLHYLFLLYNPDENVFHVAGIMSKKGFLNTARLFKVGESVAGNYTIKDFSEEEYNTEIYNLAVCELPKKGGNEMNEHKPIDWTKFQSKFLRVEPGTQHRVKLKNWRQEEKSFFDEKPRSCLVFDVVKIDENKYDDAPLEWSTSSSSLAGEFRVMIEQAEKNERDYLLVIMKRTSDKKYTVLDVSEPREE